MRWALGAALALAVSGIARADDDNPVTALKSLIEENYAYDLPEGFTTADIAPVKPGDPAANLRAAEHVLNQLADHHANLSANLADSYALVPTGADLWIECTPDCAITDIRTSSPASKAGLRPGMVLENVGDEKLDDAIERFFARPAANDEERSFAARTLAAGKRNAKRRLAFRSGGAIRRVTLEPFSSKPVESRLTVSMPTSDVIRVRFHNSLGDNRTIAEFDRAAAAFVDKKAVILDLRDTPSGGNTTILRSILGHFIDTPAAYQRHDLPVEMREYGVERSWVEWVSPRKPVFDGPLYVLVNRWTGSVGEALAIGADAAADAIVIGRPMAGLKGAIYSYDLPGADFVVRFPVERLYHVNGTPREEFMPDVIVGAGEKGDDALLAALAMINEERPKD